MRKFVIFNRAEQQSNHNRINSAERLILQLPSNHDGRNTWLLNYGILEEAVKKRNKLGIKWDSQFHSAETR